MADINADVIAQAKEACTPSTLGAFAINAETEAQNTAIGSAMGAAFGTMVPVIGTAAGAGFGALGAAIGGAIGFLDGGKSSAVEAYIDQCVGERLTTPPVAQGGQDQQR